MYKRTMSMKNLSLLAFFLLAKASLINASPQVTRVQLDTTVTAGFYVVVFDIDGSGNGVWVNPGASEGNSTTNPNPPAGPGGIGLLAAPADMYGLSSGYGQLLLSATAAGFSELVAELDSMSSNMPANANTTILGGANGPVNKTNIELDRAIPESTEVTFTVDMNGEVPHLVGVMGGSYPLVTYDPVGDSITITTSTFSTTTNALDSFSSIVGFMVITDTTLGTTPLRIIAQTNHWVGDIFPLLPGFDDSAAVENIGGDQGTITAKCGTTIYGPTGQQRMINVFCPDSSIEAMFGSGVNNTDLGAFRDSVDVSDEATITTGVSNFGVAGTRASFIYTFASPRDGSIGVSSSQGIEDDNVKTPLPDVYSLSQNYPNPFNVTTVVSYGLPARSEVSITIFDILGQNVETIVKEEQPAGFHQVTWNADGKSSGIYFYKIQAGDFTETKRMLLLK